MEIAHVVPGQGLVFDGHVGEDTPEFDEMLAAAADWLVAELGRSRRRATHETTWEPGLTAYGWVADHDRWVIHFVQEHHDGARPVTVVHVPVPPDREREAVEIAEAEAAARAVSEQPQPSSRSEAA